jgi:sugar/nucleoside kinase (ribokinase family)
MNGRDTLITDLNVLEDFNPNLPKDFQSSQFIMLGNLTPSIQASILDQLSDPPKLVILDTMNFWMDVAMDELKQLLFRVDVLTVNDEEARQLSGERSLVKAAAAIHKMGPKYLVIKKGGTWSLVVL